MPEPRPRASFLCLSPTHRFWFWLWVWSVTRSGGVDAGNCPDETCELSSDRGHRHRRALAARFESSESTRQSQVSLATHVGNGRRLLHEQLALPRRCARTMSVGPGRLDEDSSHVAVTGLGDPTAPLSLTARVLARYETQEGHELACARKATQVVDLRQDHHRGQRADAAQAAQPADHLLERLALRHGIDVLVEVFDLPIEVVPDRDRRLAYTLTPMPAPAGGGASTTRRRDDALPDLVPEPAPPPSIEDEPVEASPEPEPTPTPEPAPNPFPEIRDPFAKNSS